MYGTLSMCLPVSRCVIGLVSLLSPQKKKPLKGVDFQGLSSVVAVRTGLEPATPCVTGMYSNQLNYHTKFLFYNQRASLGPNCECKYRRHFSILQ